MRGPGSRVARTVPGAVPNHRTASFTSPPSEIHSASASAGIASCGTPGAIFSAAALGAFSAAPTAQDRGGEYASGSKIRPRFDERRAGSTNTAS